MNSFKCVVHRCIFVTRLTLRSASAGKHRDIRWDDKSVTLECPIAKATYIKREGTWKVFWPRADMKWHSYLPAPKVASVEQFLDLVRKDDHCCFFG